jgi:hypothetical protein
MKEHKIYILTCALSQKRNQNTGTRDLSHSSRKTTVHHHESHFSILTTNVAKENGNFLLTLLHHTSYKLQQVDCTVFRPYRASKNACVNAWILSKPGNYLTIYGVAGIIVKSFSKPFTKHNIEKGFHLTRIYPLNANILVTMNSYPPVSLTALTIR